MIPATVSNAYKRGFAIAGEIIKVRRYTDVGTNRPFIEFSARARVQDYQAAELVGGITQGDRRVIMLAEDLATAGFPLPLTRTDKLIVRGKELAIHALDDSTRRINGELIAYDITAKG